MNATMFSLLIGAVLKATSHEQTPWTGVIVEPMAEKAPAVVLDGKPYRP